MDAASTLDFLDNITFPHRWHTIKITKLLLVACKESICDRIFSTFYSPFNFPFLANTWHFTWHISYFVDFAIQQSKYSTASIFWIVHKVKILWPKTDNGNFFLLFRNKATWYKTLEEELEIRIEW